MNGPLSRIIKPVKRLLLSLFMFALLALAAVVLSLRYWILPNIENYSEDIAQAASTLVGQRITIGKIAADWDGYRPHLVFDDVQVFDPNDHPALVLKRVETTLSWESLLAGGVRLYSLEFKQPNLSIRRDTEGVVHVAGVALSRHDADQGFTDWLLKQEHLVIRDALILWKDEKLGAPQLVLNSVMLRIENSGDRHRLSLRASPPPDLAAPLEIEGDFSGDSFDPDDLDKWQGTLFAQVDYADLVAWRTWLPYPIEVQKGSGALRLRLTVDNAQIKEITADLQLSQVKTRLRPDLPELDLDSLNGRLGWKTLDHGFELSAAKLSLAAQGGLSLKPVDFVVRIYPAFEGQALRGEFEAGVLDLEPLAALADRLPLNPELRQRLASLAPKGSVYDVALKWNGDLPKPESYSVKGRFERLALKAYEAWPGFNNVSGSVEGNQQTGQINLEAKNIKLGLPKVFEEALQFESFKARLDWKAENSGTQYSLSNMVFANAHLSGSASGSYRTVSEGPGIVDLNAHVTRVEAKQVNRYLPLRVPQKTREWLVTALGGGAFNDLQLTMRGNLADFPFADESQGLFQVTARATGISLEYSQEWPKIENITAAMQLRGNRVEIRGSEAEILGIKLSRIDAVIPELGNPQEVLQIDVEAQAQAANFLNFIGHSPVSSMIGSFTENVHASGDGKLLLKLEIPLHQREQTKVAGTYQFHGNQLSFGPDLPPIEQVKGRLQFSEAAMQAQDLSAQILGGTASVSIATQPDRSVRIAARGKVNAAALGSKVVLPFQSYLRGSAEWRGSINLSNKINDILLESNLEGLASLLPAPFNKSAPASVLLRFEKKSTFSGHERVLLSYGNVLSMRLVRHKDGLDYERGLIVLGGRAGVPDKNGIWVSGALKSFDFDQWHTVLAQSDSGLGLDLAGIDVKLGTLDVLGRRFGETRVSARHQGGDWKATLAGAEVNGELNWYPQGKGKLVARLANLVIPEPLPEKNSAATQESEQRDFPALDIVAENFSLGDNPLGRLELQAVQQGRDWRIENLRLSNADSVLALDGSWLNFSVQPQTRVNVKLEVSDIGNLMARLKLPEGIKHGSAKLEGALYWGGSPQHIDYATLSGNLQLNAEKGQFVKLDSGVAKLLGILSLQALPRRALLDFRDIFSEGFAFDDITSSLNLNQGVATTENFHMRGPAATVNMSGAVDLAQETQNLKVRVAPSFVDSLALAGFLGGPIIGITAFLVQKALKDPLGQMIVYEYNVTGTWTDPVVIKPDSSFLPIPFLQNR
ncbi:MAG TPA: YhdP family protein [Burkholderiales bacterium]|nr:YhdP family protein [Burkholderiales bacterium]